MQTIEEIYQKMLLKEKLFDLFSRLKTLFSDSFKPQISKNKIKLICSSMDLDGLIIGITNEMIKQGAKQMKTSDPHIFEFIRDTEIVTLKTTKLKKKFEIELTTNLED